MTDLPKTMFLLSLVLLFGCGGLQPISPLSQSNTLAKAHLSSLEVLPIKAKTAPLGWNDEDTTRMWWIHHLDSMVGIWEVKKECYQIGNDTTHPTIRLIYPYIFKYDGTYLTTHFLMLTRGWTEPDWISKDGYYKMRTKWVADTLKYLNPYQQWEIAGVFQHNIFTHSSLINDTLYPIVFQKIRTSQVADYDKPILKYRKAFNYDQAR